MKEKLKIGFGMMIILILLSLIGWIMYHAISAKMDKTQNPVASFEIQDYGVVKMELYPEYAPNTVANFIALIEAGYYNNKVVYGKSNQGILYVAKNTEETAQNPTISLLDNSIEKDSDQDYEYEINGEFIANEFQKNILRHEKGVISLSRKDYSLYGLTKEGYNSGNAEICVMMQNNAELNGLYCAFGKVTQGLEIFEKIYQETQIEQGEENQENTIQKFNPMPVIVNASVEKQGIDYGKPEVHEAFDVQSYVNQLYSQYLN